MQEAHNKNYSMDKALTPHNGNHKWYKKRVLPPPLRYTNLQEAPVEAITLINVPQNNGVFCGTLIKKGKQKAQERKKRHRPTKTGYFLWDDVVLGTDAIST